MTKPPKPTERQVQRSILAMCGACLPDVLVVHVPNGAHLGGDDRSRAMQMGALKGDGLKVGFPDLLCIWRSGMALIEVKRPGGKLSDAQTEMHERLSGMGHIVSVVTSDAEAQAFLKSCGAPMRGRLSA